MADTPRGLRNNNPGNIVLSDIPWLGKIAGEDARFETFQTPEHGLRALSLNLLNYARKYGLQTIEDIIPRWAPATENNTSAYINSVSKKLGVDPAQPLNLEDPNTLAKLSSAIVAHENGKDPYVPDQYLMAAQSARGQKELAPGVTENPEQPIAAPEMVPMEEAPRIAKLTGMTTEQIAALPLNTRFEEPVQEAPQPDNESRLVRYAQYLMQNQDQIETPEYKAVAQAYRALRGEQAPAPAAEEGAETPKERAGFFSSAKESASTILGLPEAARFGVAKGEGRPAAREDLLKTAESEYEAIPLSEVSSAGDFVDWLQSTGGAMAGYLAAPGAAAGLAKILTKAPGPAKLAGYGVLGAQYAIDNLTRQAQTQQEQIDAGEDPQATNLPKALVAAYGQTKLDQLGFNFFRPLFSKFPLLNNLVGEGAEKTAKEAEDVLVDAFKNNALSTGRGVITGIGKGVAFEIPQEIAQSMLERWQAGLSLSDADARGEYFEAGAAAAIFGGGIGGVSGVFQNAAKRQEAEDILRKRAADKVKEAEPETVTTETEPVKTLTEGPQQEVTAGEVNLTQMLGGFEQVSGEAPPTTTPAAPPTTGKKVRGPAIAEWESLDDTGLAKLLEAANAVGFDPETLQGFASRFAEVKAARQDPKSNAFKLNAQVQKNTKLFKEIQRALTEPKAPTKFAKREEPSVPTVGSAVTQPPAYQRSTRQTVPVPATFSPDAGRRVPTGEIPQSAGTGRSTVRGGTRLPVQQQGPGTGTAPSGAAGLGGTGVSTQPPTGRKTLEPSTLEQEKEAREKEAQERIKGEYTSLLSGLSEVEEAAAKAVQAKEVDKELELTAQQAARREAPVTKKELSAIPTDVAAIQQLAEKALKEKRLDTFNYNRIQNLIRTARARPGFDPATDLEGVRTIVAKALRELKPTKEAGEAAYAATVKQFKQRLKEAQDLEANPETREQGAALRSEINRDISVLRKQLKLPPITKAQTVAKPSTRLEQARKFADDISGQSVVDIAQYLADNAPNKAYEVISLRVKERLQDYIDQGYRISLTVVNRGNLKNHPALARSTTLGSHTFEPTKGISQIALRGPELSINGKFGTDYETVLHELVHAVTSHSILLAGNAAPGSRLHNANKDLNKLFDTVIRHFRARKNLPDKDLTPLEIEFKLGTNALKNSRELIAWAMTNKNMQDYLESIPYKQNKTLWDNFVEIVRGFLGLSPKEDTALSEVLRISSDIMTPEVVIQTKILQDDVSSSNLSDQLNGNGLRSFVDEQRIKAPAGKPETPAEIEARLAEEIREKTGQNYGIKEAIKEKVSYRGTENLIRMFQNERRPLKRLQDALMYAGKMIVGAPGYNNIYDLIMLSSGKAFHLMTRDIQPHVQDLQSAIHDYAKAEKIDVNSALGRLHMYVMALHEPERRLIKYLKNVPLDNKTKLNFGGKEMTPADARKAIFDLLTQDVDLTKKGPDGKTDAEKLRARLEEIVERYKDQNGFSPVGTKSVDLNSADYNVVGGYTKTQIAEMKAQYDTDPHQKELSEMLSALKKIQEGTIKLDKMANYWSQPTTNLTAFYGYKNYVPFKGKPSSDVTAGDETLELGYSRVSSKDFNEFAYGTEGRLSDSDNPLIQTMVDGAKAATRAGREGVSESLKNLINQKYITGKLYKTISFEQRFNGFDPAEVMGNNKFFHYMPNGTIEVYEISEKEKPIIESIRRTFRANSPILDKANAFTSLMGAMHTRYNPAFHPYNFVRDVLTNTWTVGAEKGGKAAYNFIGSIARQVADNGFYKAGKISALYADNKVDEIKKMAFNPDGSIKDESAANILEYLEEGGRVSYVMGLAMKGQVESLLKDVGRSKIIQTRDQFNTYVDVWTDAFEFTSRAAAYAAMKSNYIAEATKRIEQRTGRKPTKAELDTVNKEARIRAAAYAKELANFEQVGLYGREAGAAFMFFRPAATGAVRAIDALRPAFESLDEALSHLPAQVRNDPSAVEEFKRSYDDRRKTAQMTVMSLAGAGAFAYMMAVLAAENDEEGRNRVLTDNMDIWTRNLRLPMKFLNPILGKDNDFFNVPWGFGAGAFAAMGAQWMGVAMGGNTFGDALANSVSVTLDSFIPVPVARFNPTDNPAAWLVDSAVPSALRPAVEYVMNVDTFGKQIYNARSSRFGDAYSGGEYVPEAYKKVTRFLAEISGGEINWQPQTVAFFANNYADGLSRVITNMYGLGLTVANSKDFDAKRDLTVFDSFVGKRSSVDAREFAELEKKIVKMRDTLSMFENRKDGGKAYLNYIEKNPEALLLVNYYNNAVNGPMRDAREKLNTISASDLPPNERRPTIDMYRTIRDMYARNFVKMAEEYGIKP
jgi:hypothetical protein